MFLLSTFLRSIFSCCCSWCVAIHSLVDWVCTTWVNGSKYVKCGLWILLLFVVILLTLGMYLMMFGTLQLSDYLLEIMCAKIILKNDTTNGTI